MPSFFQDYAAGNPKQIEELAKEVLKQEAITICEGHVNLDTEKLDNVQLPKKMLGYLRGHLDRLQVGPSLSKNIRYLIWLLGKTQVRG